MRISDWSADVCSSDLVRRGTSSSSDGHDAPRLVDELVPRLTAVVDDVVVGGEDPVGEPVIAHELPDVLDRVQLGTFGRQSDDADIRRHTELSGNVATGVNTQQIGRVTCRVRGWKSV